MMRKSLALAVLALVLTVLPPGCGEPPTDSGSGLSGQISVDGSSTVFPITEAVAEEFGRENPRVRVTVGVSGTGGGFKKYILGETDINDASRPIKESEAEQAAGKGIEYIELPIAFDGLSVVVNKKNDWVDHLTTEELNRIWKPGSTVQTWKDIRPEWPDEPMKLYGPGTDSGTFDYFTEAINGQSQAARSDFAKSEDDNVLVQGISGDRHSLGFFGFAYYSENVDKLKLVPIDSGNGPIVPSQETISNGTYSPLSRPIFIYVNPDSAKRPVVDAFVRFYLENAGALAGEVGYVALPLEAYRLVTNRYEQRKTGSAFTGGDTVGLSIQNILARESE